MKIVLFRRPYSGVGHPLVITGRGARNAGHALLRFLKASGAFYLDTQESRGLVPGRPSVIRGRRSRRSDVERRRGNRDWPEARLPTRLRLAGGIPRGPLHPPSSPRRRPHRPPPSPPTDPREPP